MDEVGSRVSKQLTPDTEVITPGDWAKLAGCIALDAAGDASELLPVLGEFTDVGFAPIEAALLKALFASNSIVSGNPVLAHSPPPLAFAVFFSPLDTVPSHTFRRRTLVTVACCPIRVRLGAGRIRIRGGDSTIHRRRPDLHPLVVPRDALAHHATRAEATTPEGGRLLTVCPAVPCAHCAQVVKRTRDRTSSFRRQIRQA